MIIILALPFLGFLMCFFFGNRIGTKGAASISNILVLVVWLCTLFFVFRPSLLNYFTLNSGYGWISHTNFFSLTWGIHVDKVTGSMLLLVSTVSLLVHTFSVSYMEGEPHLPRFLSYLSLFTFFMIVLVTAPNLPQLFIGWEGVGICSFLLINFWSTRIQANKSAIKAMILNKVGDVGFILAMCLVVFCTGSSTLMEVAPLLQNSSALLKTSICVLFFIAIVGKSAQLGLHMWLPDAMEGPTPVSALIHAATMVTAGVFLVIRLSSLFVYTPFMVFIIVFVGSLTAFISATIALVQNDVKKIIAYSTCSQLGFMVLISGYSLYENSLFHLLNHGFFKALLFLSAGSIIHLTFNEQDIRRYGLGNLSPISYIMILVGSLSLMGIPFLTGYYSKDLILELLCNQEVFLVPFAFGILATFMTSFYSVRLIVKSFYNSPQFPIIWLNNWSTNSLAISIPLAILAFFSLFLGYFWNSSLLTPYPPLIVNLPQKLIPLVVTLLGALAILARRYKNLNKYLSDIESETVWRHRFIITLGLLSKKWYFDEILNYFIIKPYLHISKNLTYKLIDTQILEQLGPSGLKSYLTYMASRTVSYGKGSFSVILFCFGGFIISFIAIGFFIN